MQARRCTTQRTTGSVSGVQSELVANPRTALNSCEQAKKQGIRVLPEQVTKSKSKGGRLLLFE